MLAQTAIRYCYNVNMLKIMQTFVYIRVLQGPKLRFIRHRRRTALRQWLVPAVADEPTTHVVPVFISIV